MSENKIELFKRTDADEDHFVMLCKDLKNLTKKEHEGLKFPTWISRKYDGIFCIAYKINSNVVQIGSRSGELYTSMQHIEKACLKIMATGTIMIFEAMIEEPQVLLKGEKETTVTFKKLNAISGACRDKKAQHPELVAYVHDWLMYPEFTGNQATSFAMRYARVSQLHDFKNLEVFRVIEQKHCPDLKVAKEMCKIILSEGGEGVVLTDPLGAYKMAYRGIDMVKLKGTISFDLLVLDVIEGKGKYKGTTGALRIQWFNGKTFDVSGMTNEQRKEWWSNPNMIIGQLVEIEAMNKSPYGVLTQPRFKCIRYDKAGCGSDVFLKNEKGKVNCYDE